MSSGMLFLLIFLTVALSIMGIYSFVADLVLSDRSRLRKLLSRRDRGLDAIQVDIPARKDHSDLFKATRQFMM